MDVTSPILIWRYDPEIKGSSQVKVEGGATVAIKSAMTNVEGSGQLVLKGGMVMIN